MITDSFKIIKEKFRDNLAGDCLLIDIKKLRDDYNYIGLWYAKDGSEKTFITTEIYLSESSEKPVKPSDYDSEIKENAFKQVNKLEISRSNSHCWIATRLDSGEYCSLKAGKIQEDRFYINYKIIHNKSFGFDIVGKGVLRGGRASFFELSSSQGSGQSEFKQAVMYVVLIKDLPPPDWNMDDAFYGIENLPVFVPSFKFTHGRKYSDWFDQNPLK